MNSEIKLGQILVGKNHPPLVVAEMSGNHNQSLDRALQIVEAAAKAGAQALKIQTYTADTMTLNLDADDFVVSDQKSLWAGKKLYELYQEAYTPWEWHKPIFEKCKRLGLEFFSTPFDQSSVDFLESLDVPFYKIASFENTDLALIRLVAQTRKPVIVSTGMATESEIEAIVAVMKAEQNPNLILLKCTSAYPSDPIFSHLLTIADMQKRFGCLIGLSDHTHGIGIAAASVVLGAVLIEKHFTLKRSDGGVDSAFSLEPEELNSLVKESRRVWLGLGQVHYGPTEGEVNSLKFRRSLYIVKDMKRGDKITPECVRSLRPLVGVPANELSKVLNQAVKVDIKSGTPLKWEMIS